MMKKSIAAIVTTLSMAAAMDSSIQDELEPKAPTKNLRITEDAQLGHKFIDPFGREYFGEWYDFINQQLDGKLEELRPNLEHIEIMFDFRKFTKMNERTFEKNKSDVEEFFHKLKRHHQNLNDSSSPLFSPIMELGNLDGFDVVGHCDEVLKRGVTIEDLIYPHVTVSYKVRGEGANLSKLDKLLEHYAKGEWMEMALFDNLPVIEKVDLTSYLKKHGLELDAGLRRLLNLKCPNLKEIIY